jgi:protein-S-isoprenylcysteine O-methyltransferase Ste14
VLWLRAFIFSIFVPGVVGVWVPLELARFRAPTGGFWQLGWIVFALGVALYVRCLRNFVAAGGTPLIFFAKPLEPVMGSEPQRLVRTDIYKYSRNPMYLAVVTMIAGEAIAFASWQIVVYCGLLFVIFHLVVTLIEEPHLRGRDRLSYEEYCRQVPRWLWLRRSRNSPTGLVRKTEPRP